VAAQLIGAGASAVVVVLVVMIINLRHMLYSASIAPYLTHLKPAWKYLIAYLLTDEAYAVAILNYEQRGATINGHWYTLGAGVALWACWQISTLVGILAGQGLAADWPLSFALPLTFIALIIPAIKNRALAGAAVVSGIVSLLANQFPYKTGLLLAVAAGILTGLWMERWKR
jgi:predicted branched-subunit amino acid permease